jgi:hypothetical protein
MSNCHDRYNAEMGIYEWSMKPTEVAEKIEIREKLFYKNYTEIEQEQTGKRE